MSIVGDLDSGGGGGGGGSSGGPTQAAFDALEVLVNSKQDSTDVSTAITSANLLQDITSMATYASQVDLNTKADSAATTAALAGKAAQADLLSLQGIVSGKADDAATTTALAGKAAQADLLTLQSTVATKADSVATTNALLLKADAASTTGAISNINSNISNILAGGPFSELDIQNVSYNSVGDNTVDSYIHARVDANSANSAGWRVRNTNHAAGSSTLSYGCWDTSVSGGGSQGAPAAEVLSMNYNADTSKKLVSTDTLAVGSIPLGSTSVGDIFCQTLKASSAVTVGGTALPDLSYYSQSTNAYVLSPTSTQTWSGTVSVSQQSGYQVVSSASGQFLDGFFPYGHPSANVSLVMSCELRRHGSSIQTLNVSVSGYWNWVGYVGQQVTLTSSWTQFSLPYNDFGLGITAMHFGTIPPGSGWSAQQGSFEIRNLSILSSVAASNLSQSLTVAGTAQAASFTSTSDASIKTGVTVASQDMCKAVFDRVEAQVYTRTDGVEGTRLGMIAQDVEAALAAADLGATNIVTRDVQNPSLLALSYDRLVCVLWQVVKSQEARIAALESGA